MSSRILVTGGAGFIGTNLVLALARRGDSVVVLDTGDAAGFDYLEGVPAEIVPGDVDDRDAVTSALEGCTAVVHLAAHTSVPESVVRPVEDFRANVSGSLALLEAVRLQRINRFVFASSNAVVGGHPPPTRETLPPNPVAPYGAAKASVEAYLRAYHHAYGLETVALRFANAYGPWSAHKTSVVAAFIKAFLDGRPLTIRGTGEQTRDFVHASDVTAAILLGLDAPASSVAGEVFQIGTGRETSLLEVVRVLSEVGGREAAIEHEPEAQGDVLRNVSDIDRARSALAYVPRVDLRDGLRSTLEWFGDSWRR